MKHFSKNTILSAIGTSIEYYDFVIYGMLMDVLNKIFFGGSIHGDLNFIMGYIARPLGGLIFGVIADNYGRKKSLILSMLTISLATFCMGLLLPNQWMLVVLLRVIQGIAFGSEMPNASIISIESSKSFKQHGLIISGSAIGSVVASGICFLLFKFLSVDSIMEFGWRIPFLFGGIISFFVFFARNGLSESLSDINNKSIFSKTIKDIISNFWLIILAIILMFLPAFLIVLNLQIPHLMSSIYEFDRSMIHLYSMIGIVVMIFINPFLSKVLRVFGKMFWIVIATMFLFAYISLIYSNILIFFIVYQFIVSSLLFRGMELSCKFFNENFRVTGTSLSYNIAFILSALFLVEIKKINLNFTYISVFFMLFLLLVYTLEAKFTKSSK